ncbi:MAG: hypothetical protein OQJ89_16645 [Kangiellaceae bacterium]|nr:hypothetical protein [Kangiellaceae bacterium]MCW9018604.1 hypothetical protein [Kangiellaceae bacterium]
MFNSLKESNNDVQGLYSVAANTATPVSQTFLIDISYHQLLRLADNLFFFKEKTTIYLSVYSTFPTVSGSLHLPFEFSDWF